MTSEPAEQQPETPPPVAGVSAPRVSGLAKASLVCGIIAVTGLLPALMMGDSWSTLGQTMAAAPLLMGLAGFTCGLAGLVGIWASKRPVVGKGSAYAGLVLSSCTSLLILTGPLPCVSPRMCIDPQCYFNMMNLCRAAINYASDHKGPFPPSNSWPETLKAGNYVADDSLFECPGNSNGNRGYAMNAKLGGLDISEIRRRTVTVLFFECAPGSPPAGGPELLPTPPRHGSGKSAAHVVGFCDGHAEIIRPNELNHLVWDPKAE